MFEVETRLPITKIERWWFGLLSLLLLSTSSVAESDPFAAGNRIVRTSIVSDRMPVQSGESAARIGVLFEIEPGWHIYWRNSGEAAIPTEVRWTLPRGWESSELQWPAPLKFNEKGDVVTYGYRERVLLFSELKSPPEVLAVAKDLEISATVSWLVCSDICVPGERTITTTLSADPTAPLTPSPHSSIFAETNSQIPQRITVKDEGALFDGERFSIPLRALAAPEITSFLKADTLQFFPYGEMKAPYLGGSAPTVIVPASSKNSPAKLSGVLAFQSGGKEFAVIIDQDFPKTDSSLPTEGAPLTYRESDSHENATEVSGAVSPPGGASIPSLLFAIFSGVFAGIILNFMPCVLPVLSLKLMGFVSHPDEGHQAHTRAALFYTLGVLASFLALAISVIILRRSGAELGWGFQFQYPGFVFVLAIVVFVLSLSFFGFYSVTLPGMQHANRFVSKLRRESALGHFTDGVLATALSTPCSAPLLGTALAFAFTQGEVAVIAIFLSIGFGLALPYLLVARNRRLMALLPKPGAWMERLKELLGFFLLGTVLWLLYVLEQLSPGSIILTLALLLMTAVLLWLRLVITNRGRIRDLVFVGVFLSLTFVSWPTTPSELRPSQGESSGLRWQVFSPDAVQQSLASGSSVFIDFTADWCITCKFNEKFVIQTSEMERLFAESKVTLFKADWTRKDAVITAELAKYGGRGVPLYVVIHPDKEPQVLPTVITAGILSEAIRRQ